MTRQEKYPDTLYFHFYNANPKNRYCGDCEARAVAVALGQTWEQTIREMTEVGIKHGLVFNDPHCTDIYLKQKGWVKHSEPRQYDNTKMEVKEAISRLNIKNAVAFVGSHHIACIKDGKVWDIWDSSRQTMHTYYVKAK